MRRDGLTPREVEVLDLASRGLANKEIAAKLCVSPMTVKTHLARLTEHTGQQGRAGLVGWAFRNGYLT